jgi:hypothetical protein
VQHSTPVGGGAQHSSAASADARTSAAADGAQAAQQASATVNDDVHDASRNTAAGICTAAAEQLGWRTLTLEHYAERNFESESQLCGCIAAEVDACVVVGDGTEAVEATLRLLQQKGVVLLHAGDLLWQAMECTGGPSTSPLGETPCTAFPRRLRTELAALRTAAAAAAELPLSPDAAELSACLQGQHAELSTMGDLEWLRAAAEGDAVAAGCTSGSPDAALQASTTQAVATLLVAHSLLHQTTRCSGGPSDGAPVVGGRQASGASKAGEGAAGSSGGALSLGARDKQHADQGLAVGTMAQHCGLALPATRCCCLQWLLGNSNVPAGAVADLRAMHTAVLDALGAAGVRSCSKRQRQQRQRGDEEPAAATLVHGRCAQLDGAWGKLHGAALVLRGVLAAGQLEGLVDKARATRAGLRDLAAAGERLQQAGRAAQAAVAVGASVAMTGGLAKGAAGGTVGSGRSGLWGERQDDGMSTESEDGEEGVAELPDDLLQLSSSFSMDR